MRGILVFFLLVFGAIPSTYAESDLLFNGGDDAIIAPLFSFSIGVTDQVSDGCLPRPATLTDAAEVVLRRNGFQVLKERTPFVPHFLLNAVGYADGQRCIVYLETFVTMPRLMVVGYAPDGDDLTLATYRVSVSGRIFSGPKSSMQSRLKTHSEEAADALFLKISRAGDAIAAKFPDLGGKIGTANQ